MSQKARNPPPARYPVRRSTVLGAILLALVIMGASALVAWGLHGIRLPLWSVALAASNWLVVAFAAFQFWRHQFTGCICWDGQAWMLEVSASAPGFWLLDCSPEIFVDLQAHIFLRVSPKGRSPVWLWLERSSSPDRWMCLRRAVYSRAVVHTDGADSGAPPNRDVA